MTPLDWRRPDRYHLEYGCGQRRGDGKTCRGQICGQHACGLYTIVKGLDAEGRTVYTSYRRTGSFGGTRMLRTHDRQAAMDACMANAADDGIDA